MPFRYALPLHWIILFYETMIATQKRMEWEGEGTITGSGLSGRLPMRDLSLWRRVWKEIFHFRYK